MHRSGNDFSYVHNLKRGKHAFKFIVDDEWRFAPDQPTVADIEGRINNFIDVSDFAPYRKLLPRIHVWYWHFSFWWWALLLILISVLCTSFLPRTVGDDSFFLKSKGTNMICRCNVSFVYWHSRPIIFLFYCSFSSIDISWLTLLVP